MSVNYYKSSCFVVDDDVWKEYAETKDIGLRNRILEAYLYIVSTNIKRMNISPAAREDIEDMTNQGVIELINCIDRYDLSRGIQFDTFASVRVRGSIIDYIRKKDWVPRNIKKRVKELDAAEQAYRCEYGRQPNDSELAVSLGIDTSEVENVRADEARMNVLEFEELLQNSGHEIAGGDEPEGIALAAELKNVLARYIDELDKNERTVLSMYYYEELKLKEIAFVMELTPARISQIHSKALAKLKERLGKYING